MVQFCTTESLPTSDCVACQHERTEQASCTQRMVVTYNAITALPADIKVKERHVCNAGGGDTRALGEVDTEALDGHIRGSRGRDDFTELRHDHLACGNVAWWIEVQHPCLPVDVVLEHADNQSLVMPSHDHTHTPSPTRSAASRNVRIATHLSRGIQLRQDVFTVVACRGLETIHGWRRWVDGDGAVGSVNGRNLHVVVRPAERPVAVQPRIRR